MSFNINDSIAVERACKMSISIKGGIVNANNFPDHTQVLKIKSTRKNNDLDTQARVKEETITWNYESDAEMATLYFIVNHLRSHNPDIKLILNMPYIPNARMDRVNNEYEVFTLKYFAKFINDMNFYEVNVLDAHSFVSLALLNRANQTDVKPYIETAIRQSKPDIVFMPDEGAHKRYTSMINDLPSTFGIKHRDWQTGDILSYEVAEPELIKDADILIIDDISSKGGTFFFAAKALLKCGAKSVSLYVTHCEHTIVEGELLRDESPIKHVYTANPLFDTPLSEPYLNAEKFTILNT